MTKLEGLKELKKLHCSNDVDCTKCVLNPFCAYYKFVFPLEQQETPQKPIIINNENTCPNCSEQTLRYFRKCCNCGQVLDWSKYNE